MQLGGETRCRSGDFFLAIANQSAAMKPVEAESQKYQKYHRIL